MSHRELRNWTIAPSPFNAGYAGLGQPGGKTQNPGPSLKRKSEPNSKTWNTGKKALQADILSDPEFSVRF